MSKTLTALLIAGFAWSVVFSRVTTAQGDDAAKADDSAAKQADVEALYTPPKTNDAASMQKWVETVSQTPAPDTSQAGIRQHFGKLEQAADAVIARAGVEEAGVIEAIRLKVGANTVLEEFGDTAAAQRKSQLIARLKQDPRPAIAVHGRLLDVEQQIANIQPDDNAAAQKLIDQVVALLKDKPLTDAHVSVAYSAAETIEVNANEKLATAAYNVFAKYLKASDNPGHRSVAEMFEGATRRLNLVGNPVKISGQTLDGTTFNIDHWKGKIVLVDFWATWCGPCLEELPNIKTLYDKHHADGFEVVGVNMDDNIGRVDAFVKTQQIPWPHIVSDKGQDSPLANYYGVSQLPTTFLVGRDGKVTEVDLYGEDLTAEIDRLIKQGM